MRKNACRTILAAVSVVLLANLSACGLLGSSSNDSGPSGDLEKGKIKVSLIVSVDPAAHLHAMNAGYFKAEGLDVEVITADTGEKSQTNVLSNTVDIAFTTYPLIFTAASKNVADLRIVADCTSASPKSNMVVATPGSPVKTIGDLAGKRIGITSKNAVSHIITQSLMKDHGVDSSKVTWVPAPLPNMANSLKNGDLDAAYLPEPFITQAAKSVGSQPIVDASSGATQDFPIIGFVARKEFVEKYPKTLAAWQRALFKANRDITKDEALLRATVAKYAKVDADTAALMTLPTYNTVANASRIQRVADLLQTLGVIPTRIDAGPMIVPMATG